MIAAGGATEFGDLRFVVLTRGKIRSEYDLTNLEHRSVIIKPDDVIDVPAKPFAGQ
jgi:hypothetical protein